MKKLIKDLTQEEINRFCKKYYGNNDNCIGCPLYALKIEDCYRIEKEIKKFNEDINKEVEIPEVEE